MLSSMLGWTMLFILKSLGPGSFMVKTDLKLAFHLIPVHPEDWHLLGIYWQQQYYMYVDLYLPFRLRSAPFPFSQLSDALNWVLKSTIMGYSMFSISWSIFSQLNRPVSNACPALVNDFAFSCPSKHQSSPPKPWGPPKYLSSWVLSLIPLVWRSGFQRTNSNAPRIYPLPLLKTAPCDWSNCNRYFAIHM